MPLLSEYPLARRPRQSETGTIKSRVAAAQNQINEQLHSAIVGTFLRLITAATLIIARRRALKDVLDLLLPGICLVTALRIVIESPTRALLPACI